jgi:hypothetical protein
MDISEKYFECNEPSVIFERFDDETILINLDSGRYYSLDPVGVVVWELINRPLAMADLLERLEGHFDAEPSQVRTSILEFIGRLEEEQLIRPRREAPPSEETAAVDAILPQARTFSAPVLARYEDMAEMLLLDPVHDVAETGWPQTPAASAPETVTRVEVDDASSWPSLDDEK